MTSTASVFGFDDTTEASGLDTAINWSRRFSQFVTLRLRLLKIAVRVQEATSRIRLAFASCCPDADLVRRLAGALAPQPRAASP